MAKHRENSLCKHGKRQAKKGLNKEKKRKDRVETGRGKGIVSQQWESASGVYSVHCTFIYLLQI